MEETKTQAGQEQAANETIYFAYETGQIVVEGDYMRIGVGNFDEEEYTDANNQTQTGPTAGLWFFIRARPDLEQQVRVHEDQVLEVIGHKIRIIEIDNEDNHIALGITLPDKPVDIPPPDEQ